MSGFVDECRKEWSRLGVPDAASNEMTAELAADLAEAEADGASAEEVLGNGVFDARSFAASWATARGLVPCEHPAPGGIRTRWAVAVSALVSFVAGAAGLVLLARRQGASVASAVFRRSFHLSVPGFSGPRSFRIGPHLPGSTIFLRSSGFQALGVILVLVGVIGLGLTLWLWKPWSTRRGRSGFDDSMGLPSYF